MVIAVQGTLLHHQTSSFADLSGFRERRSSTRNASTHSPQNLVRSSCIPSVKSKSSLASQHVGTLTPYELRPITPRAGSVAGVAAAAHMANAAIAETDGPELKWWEKGSAPNIYDVHSTQEFLDALSGAGEKLVVVEFYATWCGSCRALYPKFCKLAAEYSDASFIKVNFDENKPMCKSLNIKVLPFFHIYKGAAGKVDGFSCSLSKLQRLKDAIATNYRNDVSVEGEAADTGGAIQAGSSGDSVVESNEGQSAAAVETSG